MLYGYKNASFDESILIKESFINFVILLHKFSNLSLNIKVELFLIHNMGHEGLKNARL